MENNGQNQNSALSTIARHERELLAKRERTEQEAERIVAEARVEARRIQETEAERIATEIAAIRQEGETARERERIERQNQAEQRLNEMRAAAQTRAAAVVGAITSLVLPPTSGESR